jgi:hypothetical protein
MAPRSAAGPEASKARSEALLEVAESISAGRYLDPPFAKLSSRLKRLPEFDRIALTVADFEQGVVRVHIRASDRPLSGGPVPKCGLRPCLSIQ